MVRTLKKEIGTGTPGRPSKRRLSRLFLVTLSCLWPLIVTSSSSSPVRIAEDSATVVAMAFVRPLARVTEEREFTFPDDPPGAEPVTISPSDKRALAFSFGGEVHQSYHIVFPPYLNVQLQGTSSSHPDRLVKIFDFSSSQSGPGLFPSNGDLARASLGATRAKLRNSQKAGTYIGTLPVTILYP